MAECWSYIAGKYGLSEEDAQAIVREVQAMGEGAGNGRASTRAKRGALAAAGELDAKAGDEKKAAILRLNARDRRSANVESFDDLYDGLEAESVGTGAGRGVGSRRSTDTYAKMAQGEVIGSLFNDLAEIVGSKRALTKLSSDKPFNLDVAREMWAGLDGSTGNEVARRVAEVLVRYKDAAVERANRAGAFIKHLPGHIFSQVHDAGRLLKMGQRGWVDYILSELDIERTFGAETPPERIREILNESWVTITTGVRPGEGNRPSFGGMSLAARLSRDRVFHFRDADAAIRYNDQFGRKTTLQAVFDNLRTLTHDTAIMEMWGPNPDDLWRRLLGKYERQIRRQWAEKKRTLNPATWLTPWRDPMEALEARWEHLTGSAHYPASRSWARLVQNLRDLEVLSKMGGVVITSFTDMVNGAALGRLTGRTLLGTYADQLRSLTPRAPEQTRALRAMGFGIDSMLSDIAGRFSVTDGTTGIMSKLADQMFRFNLLRVWTDALDAGHAWAISNLMAEAVGRPFGELDETMRNTLSLYRLGEDQWDALRAAVREVGRGESVIAQELIEDMETRISWMTFLQDSVDTAIPKPGARERAIALGRARAGTVWGELARSIWQFKMFSLTVMTRVIPRLVQDGVPGWAHYALGTMLMGYASMTVRDMASGKLPQDPQRPGTWAAALVRGGGAGILGDLLLHDYGRYGRGFAEVAAGPVAGLVGDTAKIISGVVQGRDSSAEAFRVAMSNMPFSNLFYLKSAIDYLFTYQVLESLNPGYMRRMERRLKEEGSGFWLRPQDAPRLIPRL